MKVLLETNDRNEIIKFLVSILTAKYNEYKSMFECSNAEMEAFIVNSIIETLCDTKCYFGTGFVDGIGNILVYNPYIFCVYCGEDCNTPFYKIIYDNECKKYFVDGWYDWSLWDDYDKCLEEACLIFRSKFEK